MMVTRNKEVFLVMLVDVSSIWDEGVAGKVCEYVNPVSDNVFRALLNLRCA